MAAADKRPLRILQLTDCHLPAQREELVQGLDTEGSLRAVLDQALAEEPPYDLALWTGDLVEQPSPSAYALLQEQLHRLPVPYLYLPGNHDDPGMMRTCLPDAAGVSMNPISNWRILCLDSTLPGRSEGFLRDDQLARVAATLHENPASDLLIAIHHHPVPCGSPWMDAMMLGNGSALLDLLQTPASGRRIVIFGHIHQAFDIEIGRVRLLGAPATSCQFEPRSRSFCRAALPPGYRWLTLGAAGRFDTGIRYLQGSATAGGKLPQQ